MASLWAAGIGQASSSAARRQHDGRPAEEELYQIMMADQLRRSRILSNYDGRPAEEESDCIKLWWQVSWGEVRCCQTMMADKLRRNQMVSNYDGNPAEEESDFVKL